MFARRLYAVSDGGYGKRAPVRFRASVFHVKHVSWPANIGASVFHVKQRCAGNVHERCVPRGRASVGSARASPSSKRPIPLEPGLPGAYFRRGDPGSAGGLAGRGAWRAARLAAAIDPKRAGQRNRRASGGVEGSLCPGEAPCARLVLGFLEMLRSCLQPASQLAAGRFMRNSQATL